MCSWNSLCVGGNHRFSHVIFVFVWLSMKNVIYTYYICFKKPEFFNKFYTFAHSIYPKQPHTQSEILFLSHATMLYKKKRGWIDQHLRIISNWISMFIAQIIIVSFYFIYNGYPTFILQVNRHKLIANRNATHWKPTTADFYSKLELWMWADTTLVTHWSLRMSPSWLG